MLVCSGYICCVCLFLGSEVSEVDEATLDFDPGRIAPTIRGFADALWQVVLALPRTTILHLLVVRSLSQVVRVVVGFYEVAVINLVNGITTVDELEHDSMGQITPTINPQCDIAITRDAPSSRARTPPFVLGGRPPNQHTVIIDEEHFLEAR
jgi:hypothetical protein